MADTFIKITKKVRPEGRKTDIYVVTNSQNGVLLGHLEWYGPFRAYTFKPEKDLIFDSKCLKQIAMILDSLMKEWREAKDNKKKLK